MGEKSTKVVVDSAMEFFGQEALEEFNQWLDKPQTIKRINQAIEKAESCFRETTEIDILHEEISKLHGLSLVDHPKLLISLEKWQKNPTTTIWNEVIYQIFKQDYGGRITEQSLRTASREYELCLRKHLAMLMDDKWTPKITTDAILHNEELLERQEIRIKNMGTM